ncbi:MAG: mechanosensitive ion channel domain-containing protein [bacterium]
MNIKLLALVLSLLGNIPSTYCILELIQPSQQPQQQQQQDILFASVSKQRDNQFTLLQQELEQFKKTAQSTVISLKTESEKLSKELTQAIKTKTETPARNKRKIEYLDKKITFLTEQKQILLTIENTYKSIEETRENRIKIVKEIIDLLLEKQTKQLKETYTWQELLAEQEKVAEITGKIVLTKHKKDLVQKNKTSEQETISSLKKQTDIKITERDKALADLKEQLKKSIDEDQSLAERIGYTENIFNNEIANLKKKEELTHIKIEKLEQESKLKIDEIDLFENQLTQEKNILTGIEKRLLVTKKDAENAEQEANNENQNALKIKNALNAKTTELRANKSKLDIKIDQLNKYIKNLKDAGRQESVQTHQAKAELKNIESLYFAFDREISMLNTQADLLDAQVKEKKLWAERIDLHRRLASKKEDFGPLLSKFTSKRDEDASILKKLLDKRQQSTDVSLEIDKKSALIEKDKTYIQNKKDTLYRTDEEIFNTTIQNLEKAKKHLESQRKLFSQENIDTSNLIERQEKIIKQYDVIIEIIEARKTEQNIWERSPKAISLPAFKKSLLEAEQFYKKLFWDTPAHLAPSVIFASLKNILWADFFALIFFIIFFLCLFFSTRKILEIILKKIQKNLSTGRQHISSLSLNTGVTIVKFALEHLFVISLWTFLYLHIVFDFGYIFFSLRFFAKPYYITLFYLLTIPTMLYLSRQLLLMLKELNKQLSFLLFAEKLQDRFLLLISSFCYSTAILIPLKLAFLAYFPMEPTTLPNVIKAAYSLILVVILLLFFSKEDVLRIIPSSFKFLIFIKKKIDQHYYPVFIFLMGLLILANPYIGYLNLSWYLAFAVPSTVFFIYALFFTHNYIRKQSIFLFVKEEDDDIVDKFEYAKTYYGILVIVSFIALSLITFILISYIWGYEYTLTEIWKAFSDRWVLPITPEYKLGLVQLLSFIMFIVSGIFISSIIHKFILKKLFEILRTEPGAQNTYSKMLHYTIISLVTLLGLMYIHLETLFWYIGTFLGVAVGLAIKDIASDFIAGLFVLIERPIEIGNLITLNNEAHTQGVVQKINARTTIVSNRFKHSIVIPNKDIVSKTICNWGKGRFAVGFEVEIRVDYNSDIDLVKKTIQEVIQTNAAILRIPKVIIRLENFEESALYFMVRAFISTRRVNDQWDIAAELREQMFKSFKAKNIEFAFPQNVVTMRPNNKTQSPIAVKFDNE